MENNRKNNKRNRLLELNHSDYKVAENQPNIDNWRILDTSGKKFGKVKDLLFDEQALKVRYIVTNLKKGELLDEDRNVLIPIGQAQLDRDNERVVVPAISRDTLSNLPPYKKAGDLTYEDETRIRNCFAGTTEGSYDHNNFYDHEHFDENRFYANDRDHDRDTISSRKVDVVEEHMEVGKREVETGGERISSRIVERPVEERVQLKEEHVRVNRNRVDRPADSASLENYENRTIEEYETSEVPVVSKEARVVEEVSLEKDVEIREEVIKDTVRQTEVDVEHLEGEHQRNTHRNSNDHNRERSNTGTGDRDRNFSRERRNRDGDVAGRDSIRDRE